jgi:undecaprenyl-diphosphatase
MSTLERIINADYWLFFKINGTWTNGFLDAVFPFLRESVLWIPLYLFLLIFIWVNFGVPGLYWAVVFICTASLCDIISSHVIKESIMRLRPCRTPGIVGDVRFLVKYCPMGSGFVSSHATSHFGMAVFVYATLQKFISGWAGLFFAWAAMISYAQVYVGVHFPLDVVCGALVGCLIGTVMSRLFNRYILLNLPVKARI